MTIRSSINEMGMIAKAVSDQLREHMEDPPKVDVYQKVGSWDYQVQLGESGVGFTITWADAAFVQHTLMTWGSVVGTKTAIAAKVYALQTAPTSPPPFA